jgi:hypothetical protein
MSSGKERNVPKRTRDAIWNLRVPKMEPRNQSKSRNENGPRPARIGRSRGQISKSASTYLRTTAKITTSVNSVSDSMKARPSTSSN